jgi:hypothetical protein
VRILKREGIAVMLMHTTHLDAEWQCRMFCRPIRTGSLVVGRRCCGLCHLKDAFNLNADLDENRGLSDEKVAKLVEINSLDDG